MNYDKFIWKLFLSHKGRYKEKYGPKCQAITIWTIKDVEKRNCAKEHKLNFKEVWSLDEGKKIYR